MQAMMPKLSQTDSYQADAAHLPCLAPHFSKANHDRESGIGYRSIFKVDLK